MCVTNVPRIPWIDYFISLQRMQWCNQFDRLSSEIQDWFYWPHWNLDRLPAHSLCSNARNCQAQSWCHVYPHVDCWAMVYKPHYSVIWLIRSKTSNCFHLINAATLSTFKPYIFFFVEWNSYDHYTYVINLSIYDVNNFLRKMLGRCIKS